LSKPDGERELDEALIIQMLLEHEKRLKRIDRELNSIREYLTDVDELREQMSKWLKLTERLRRIEPLMRQGLLDKR